MCTFADPCSKWKSFSQFAHSFLSALHKINEKPYSIRSLSELFYRRPGCNPVLPVTFQSQSFSLPLVAFWSFSTCQIRFPSTSHNRLLSTIQVPCLSNFGPLNALHARDLDVISSPLSRRKPDASAPQKPLTDCQPAAYQTDLW